MVAEMARKRPLSANDVADWFVNRADRDGEAITAPVVQRLIFLAQAWFLANKGRPLFADDFQAWATGPVAPSVFERFEGYPYDNLPQIENARAITGEKLELLEGVQERYGCYKAWKLDEIVQEEGGPWEKARGRRSPEAHCDAVIGKDAIKGFYGVKIGNAWA